ncbi:hypothetical protein [Streptomyces echinatus]|uniref:hypothetical protein n=1 Tax=Streptomyces echinatus TaxID=67293 RepID=UPI0031EFA374
MGAIVFNVTTAALMIMMVNCGLGVVGRDTVRGRPIPWAAVILTAIAVGGVLLQMVWSGAMPALDADPTRSGWWREFTSVFLQNGGVFGALWNLVTLAVVAALAQWYWGGPLTLGFFVAGIVLPGRIDSLLGFADGPQHRPPELRRQLRRHLLPRRHSRPGLPDAHPPPQRTRPGDRRPGAGPGDVARPGQRPRPGLRLRLRPRRSGLGGPHPVARRQHEREPLDRTRPVIEPGPGSTP